LSIYKGRWKRYRKEKRGTLFSTTRRNHISFEASVHPRSSSSTLIYRGRVVFTFLQWHRTRCMYVAHTYNSDGRFKNQKTHSRTHSTPHPRLSYVTHSLVLSLSLSFPFSFSPPPPPLLTLSFSVSLFLVSIPPNLESRRCGAPTLALNSGKSHAHTSK